MNAFEYETSFCHSQWRCRKISFIQMYKNSLIIITCLLYKLTFWWHGRQTVVGKKRNHDKKKRKVGKTKIPSYVHIDNICFVICLSGLLPKCLSTLYIWWGFLMLTHTDFFFGILVCCCFIIFLFYMWTKKNCMKNEINALSLSCLILFICNFLLEISFTFNPFYYVRHAHNFIHFFFTKNIKIENFRSSNLKIWIILCYSFFILFIKQT